MHLPASLPILDVLILMMPHQDVCLHMMPIRVSVRICCVRGTNVHGPDKLQLKLPCWHGLGQHCLLHAR